MSAGSSHPDSPGHGHVAVAPCCTQTDANEAEIGDGGGLEAILLAAAHGDLELKGQAARALRNLSVREENKAIIRRLDGVNTLVKLSRSSNDKIKQQATRALMNLGEIA